MKVVHSFAGIDYTIIKVDIGSKNLITLFKPNGFKYNYAINASDEYIEELKSNDELKNAHCATALQWFLNKEGKHPHW